MELLTVDGKMARTPNGLIKAPNIMQVYLTKAGSQGAQCPEEIYNDTYSTTPSKMYDKQPNPSVGDLLLYAFNNENTKGQNLIMCEIASFGEGGVANLTPLYFPQGKTGGTGERGQDGADGKDGRDGLDIQLYHARDNWTGETAPEELPTVAISTYYEKVTDAQIDARDGDLFLYRYNNANSKGRTHLLCKIIDCNTDGREYPYTGISVMPLCWVQGEKGERGDTLLIAHINRQETAANLDSLTIGVWNRTPKIGEPFILITGCEIAYGTVKQFLNNGELVQVENLEVHSFKVEGTDITVDAKLSNESTNPVQNKVVTAKINEMDTQLQALVGGGKTPIAVGDNVSTIYIDNSEVGAKKILNTTYRIIDFANGKTLIAATPTTNVWLFYLCNEDGENIDFMFYQSQDLFGYGWTGWNPAFTGSYEINSTVTANGGGLFDDSDFIWQSSEGIKEKIADIEAKVGSTIITGAKLVIV